MEKIAQHAFRWRYGVVAAELLLAAGCLYFGWNAVAPVAAAAQVRVHHAAAAPIDALGALRIGPVAVPMAGAGTGAARTGAAGGLQPPSLGPDWLSRLNADDYDLYRGQWQTLQLLMSGVRQYLEQRVVPRLLGQ